MKKRSTGWLVDEYDRAGYRIPIDKIIRSLKDWRPEDGVLPLRDAGQAIRANDIVPRDISGAIQLLDAGMADDAKVLVNATIQDLEQIHDIRREAPVEEHHLYTIVGAYEKKYGRGVPMRTDVMQVYQDAYEPNLETDSSSDNGDLADFDIDVYEPPITTKDYDGKRKRRVDRGREAPTTVREVPGSHTPVIFPRSI